MDPLPLRFPIPRPVPQPPQMSAAQPDFRSRIVNAMNVSETRGGRDWAERLLGLAEMTPFGLVTGAGDVAGAVYDWNPLQAAAMAAMLMPAVRGRPRNAMLSPAGRTDRAEQMGFNLGTTWYHGTPHPGFSSFDPALSGSTSNFALNGRPAIWLTDNQNVASHFASTMTRRNPDAGMGGIYPLVARPGDRPIRVNYEGYNPSPNEWYANIENIFDQAARTRGGPPSSIIFQNVPFNYSRTGEGQGMANHMLVMQPNQLRSPWAAFDPSQASSGNILAGLTGAGFAVPAYLSSDQFGSQR